MLLVVTSDVACCHAYWSSVSVDVVTSDIDDIVLICNYLCHQVLQFSTHVRSKETRNLTIHNKTHVESIIHPILDGEHWSGPETLTIGPGQSHHYDLTYHPLEMTTETHRHTGSIFFPHPDGTGVLYHLLGIAEYPKQVAQINQEVPCKTPHTELLPVENWLAKPQRFVVKRDILKPDRVDHTTSLDGLDYIDVPAMGRKDYQLYFNSFKECSIMGKVSTQYISIDGI